MTFSGASIVYLSACDWAAPWHGPQEIATRLGADGHRVAYVETLGRRRPRPGDLRKVTRRLGKAMRPAGARLPAPGVELVSPLVLPGARLRVERAVNRALVLRALGRAALDGSPRILWVYTPTRLTLDVVLRFPADLVLYHCTQSHRHRPGAPPDTEQIEGELIERSDLIVTDAIELYREREWRHPLVHRIPSGVNPWGEQVTPAPPWAGRYAGPIAGYLGSIDHRLDLELIEAAARAHPDWSLVLVGPVGDAPIGILRQLRNVHFRPQVAPGEIPSVLSMFDVGLLPYASIPMTRYTYPAKLHQYFAAGLPIASTPLPDLAEFGSLVEVGEGPGGFVAAIERALASPDRRSQRRDVARRHSWDARYSDLKEAIGEALLHVRSSVSR